MKIIIIIECACGMPGPEGYVRQICNILDVKFDSNVTLQLKYCGFSCYLVQGVDRSRYKSTCEDEISDLAYELFRDSLIEYFYIGEYNDMESIKEKLVPSL